MLNGLTTRVIGGLTSYGVPRGAAPFNPRSLFAAGEQGAIYDPSDFSTMFQDAAGTTPVTAVEQNVGKILDKSGRGNHAYQTTSASRPLLSARYNLLTKTEQFDDAAWVKTNESVSPNTSETLDPFGGNNADKITHTSSTAGETLQNITFNNTYEYKYSLYVKKANTDWLRVVCVFNSPTIVASQFWVNVSTGTIGTSSTIGIGCIITSTASESIGNGWYKVSITASSTSAGAGYVQINTASADASTIRVAGSYYIWGASLVPADQASLPYQRVNTTTDYDTVGFKPYLKFDGTDDFLVTNSIDFTATDKMTMWAGVRKPSDASRGIVCELSSDLNAHNGSFVFTAPYATSEWKFAFASKGTVSTVIYAADAIYSAPITSIIACIGDIWGDIEKLRINGTQVASSAADQGTGTYGNHPLYIGRRGGTALPFNGQIYSLIIRGAQSTDAQIIAAEKYCNSKTGAY